MKIGKVVSFFSVFMINCVCFGCLGNRQHKSESISVQAVDKHLYSSKALYQELLNDNKNNIVIYIEGDYCASCHVSRIMPILYFLKDSIGYDKPTMIYHPYHDDQGMEMLFREYYGNDCNLIYTTEDSIRIKNKWMDPSINFYGIIIDSQNEILYSGFLYDEKLLTKAKTLYRDGYDF